MIMPWINFNYRPKNACTGSTWKNIISSHAFLLSMHRFYLLMALMGFIINFPSTLLVMKHLLLYLLLGWLGPCRFFYNIITINQIVMLKKLLVYKTLCLDQLKSSPYLGIQLHIFKKYEWQRKLLRHEFHRFWQHKAFV